MTPSELERFFHALAETYDVHKDIERKPELKRIWSESLQGTNQFHVKRALTEWITYNNRAPSVNDIALLVLDYRRKEKAQEQAEIEQESYQVITGELPPKMSPDNEICHAWMGFHLSWIRKMLNSSPAPWQGLKMAYRDLAGEHPELAGDCEKALALYGEIL